MSRESTMNRRKKPGDGAEQGMRDQEVLRANRELAAYFKGRRTEREARAALRIIKAFVRDRERRDLRSRPPLPGASPAVREAASERGAATGAGQRPPRRKTRRESSKRPSRTIKVPVKLDARRSSAPPEPPAE